MGFSAIILAESFFACESRENAGSKGSRTSYSMASIYTGSSNSLEDVAFFTRRENFAVKQRGCGKFAVEFGIDCIYIFFFFIEGGIFFANTGMDALSVSYDINSVIIGCFLSLSLFQVSCRS